jgi:hypothetical protein
MQLSIPGGGSGMPATVVAIMKTMFQTWFTNAVASTFVVAVIFAAVGGLCALLLRRNAAEAVVAADAAVAPTGDA